MNNIPIISQNDPELKEKLHDAFTNIGFAAIKDNQHIDKRTLEYAYDIAEIFFGLPKSEKLQAVIEGSFGQRGYTPFGIEKAKDSNQPDLKEFFQTNNELYKKVGLSIFDFPNYQLTNLYKQMDGLARSLLMTLDNQYCTPLIGTIYERVSILRAIHYPPTGENPKGVRSAAHEDINLITILPAASAAGLQVLNKNGEWIDTPTDPDLVIVNVGDMLQEHSGGKYKSTTHRVVNTKEGETKSRYSMPFFFHPKPSMVLSERYTAESYLDERLRQIGLK